MKELAQEYLKLSHLSFLKRDKNKELYLKIIEETNYLPENAEVRQRLFHIANGLKSIVLCKNCEKNPVSWNKHQYLEYCSSLCSNNSKTVKNKKAETFIERFGVDNPFKSKTIIEKIQQTNLEKFGHVCNLHGSQKEEIEKIFLEKYGATIPTSSPIIREKINKIFEEKFGGSCPLKSEKVKETLKKTVEKKYGVSHVSQKHYSKETIEKLNDKNYLITEHHNNKKPLFEIGKELGIDGTTIGEYFKKHNIEVKLFYQSLGEKEICNYLKELNINHLPREKVNGVEVDILIPDHNLAIEYNGLYWHSEENGKDKHYHKNKTDHCKHNRIRLLHIYEDEWLEHSEIIKTKLSILLNKYSGQRIFARNCKIVINPKCKEFLEKYHIQSSINTKINIGLTFGGNLVAVMCFMEIKEGIWDLRRFATSGIVVGGFSKILSYFKENHSWNIIYSFADLRMSDGNLYEKNNFKIDKILRPDYEYIVDGKRIHKFNFRHKRLAKILENYDPQKSERENCLNHGIFRIWDVGKIRYKIEKGLGTL